MKTSDPEKVEPYHALASGYDVVMEHVEYDAWAAFVHRLITRFHPKSERILELGCGTGSFSLALQPLRDYQYAGTDRSESMVRVAREKAALAGIPVQFQVGDFAGFIVDEPVDVILLMYDGVNYLLEEERVRDLLDAAYAALVPGGLFVFDVSTPANSLNNAEYFDDEGSVDDFRFVRRSRYDREARLHYTFFQMDVEGRRYEETHIQRAYSVAEIQSQISETDFEELVAYEDFTTRRASDASERIHWVLRRPAEHDTSEPASG